MKKEEVNGGLNLLLTNNQIETLAWALKFMKDYERKHKLTREVDNYSKIIEQVKNSDPKKNKDREKQIQNLGELIRKVEKENK
jgi:hypothetical protein